jgi:hypothetical protein
LVRDGETSPATAGASRARAGARFTASRLKIREVVHAVSGTLLLLVWH